MEERNSIQIFNEKEVRTLWDEDAEKWFVSIVDVVYILTGSVNPRKYWSEVSENIGQLKMKCPNRRIF